MKRQLPPLNLLVAFEAAVRCGSFTRAGEDVGLSQASVSRQIRQLEQDLGLPLFKRGRYDVSPTEHGLALAETVRDALSDIARTASRLRAAARGEGTLTIFSDLGVAGILIAPCVGEFQRRYPDLDLRVLTSAEPIETVEQDFDFGLQHGHWAEERYHIEPIADDALFPVCAPALAAELQKDCTPGDLAAQPLLHLSQDGRDWPDWGRFFEAFGIAPPILASKFQFNSYALLLDVAERGEGIAIGWARSTKPRLDAGTLVRLSGLYLPMADHIGAYIPRSSRTNPLVREFVDLLRSKVEPLDLL